MTDGIGSLAAFAAHCQALSVSHGPLFGALFLAGLVGSASHCAGMCGPFVLAQTGSRMAHLPASGTAFGYELRRLNAGMALPYQLGRATTYVVMGAILATPFSMAGSIAGASYLVPSLLIFAASIFAWQAWRGFGLSVPSLWSSALAGRTVSLLRAPFGWRGYALGLMLGFLPCGLLYGALAAAAATADPLAAAIGMIGFVLGTVPALWAVGYMGGRASLRWQPLARRAMPFIAGFNACILLAMALRAVIQV
jgi:sulfite exporter TauE/SafE